MRGVFEDEESGLRGAKRDTELTLGSGTLLLIFFGLVLLCGLCFGMGYAIGHRTPLAPQATTQSADGSQTPLQSNAGLSKPSATLQTVVAPPPQTSAASPLFSAPATSAPVSAAAPIPAAPAVQASQSMVHPALATGPATLQLAQSSAPTVHPALGPQAPLMVQIAAVENPEDADVLMSALRRRGYAVTAVRNPVDNLIHVRIGPFANRQEAGSWQQRLLNDGYNAIIIP